MTAYLVRLRRSRSKVVHFWTYPRPLCGDQQFIHGARARMSLQDGVYDFVSADELAARGLHICKRCLSTVQGMNKLILEAEGLGDVDD